MAIWKWQQSPGAKTQNIGVDDSVLKSSVFEAWYKSLGALANRAWWEVPWHWYKFNANTISEAQMAAKWGPAEAVAPLPPAPPPAPPALPATVTYDGQEFRRDVVREIGEPDDIIAWLKANRPAKDGLDGWLEYWMKVSAGHRDYAAYIHSKAMGLEPWKAEAVPVAIETELHRAWREFAEKPDVVKALGLLPSSTIESFSRVFSGYSYIDDRPTPARTGDYVAVGSIIAGLALAAAASVMALAAGAGKITVGTAIENIMTNWGRGAAAAATPKAALQYVVTNEGIITTAVSGLPGKAILIWHQIAALPVWAKLGMAMSGAFLLTQLDATGWFFGLSPEASHRKAERLLSAITTSMIRLDDLVDKKMWDEAKPLAEATDKQIKEVVAILDAWPAKFWEFFGFSFADKRAILEAQIVNFDGYRAMYPQLAGLPAALPETLAVHVTEVMDGDTVAVEGYPHVRFAGMDAHESGTEAGMAETAYLKSLIDGKTITLKIDPLNQYDAYGRILGVPYLEGVNVVHLMLARFGKDIIGTKYKNKYVDYNENTRIAKGEVAPEVPPGVEPPVVVKPAFKIRIDSVPSNAKLFIDGEYTGHLTPSDEKELKDVMHLLAPGEHVIKATKAGKEASQRVTIVEGANPDIFLTLKTVGMVPAVPEVITPVITPPEVPVEMPPVVEFKINIVSTPSNAKLFIDGEYTRHLTPSNERELRDVMHLLAPGRHTIRLEKAGKTAERTVEIAAGANPDIFMSLEVVGLPRSKADVEKEIKAAEVLLEKLKAELAAL